MSPSHKPLATVSSATHHITTSPCLHRIFRIWTLLLLKVTPYLTWSPLKISPSTILLISTLMFRRLLRPSETVTDQQWSLRPHSHTLPCRHPPTRQQIVKCSLPVHWTASPSGRAKSGGSWRRISPGQSQARCCQVTRHLLSITARMSIPPKPSIL